MGKGDFLLSEPEHLYL